MKLSMYILEKKEREVSFKNRLEKWRTRALYFDVEKKKKKKEETAVSY